MKIISATIFAAACFCSGFYLGIGVNIMEMQGGTELSVMADVYRVMFYFAVSTFLFSMALLAVTYS